MVNSLNCNLEAICRVSPLNDYNTTSRELFADLTYFINPSERNFLISGTSVILVLHSEKNLPQLLMVGVNNVANGDCLVLLFVL